MLLYPAKGETQVACGTENGIWGAWYIVDGIPQKFRHQSNRESAVQLYDDLADGLKRIMEGKE